MWWLLVLHLVRVWCCGGCCWSSVGVGYWSSVGTSLRLAGLNSSSVRDKVFAGLNSGSGKD